MVRTRFAPSPTGYLHIGGVRTALFNWLFARRHEGQFILRIDDTDVQRNVDDALRPILDDLRWLGIDWDEGPGVGGPYAPYYQLQRSDRYRDAVRRLLQVGLAYRDYAKPEEIQAEREVAQREKRRFLYSRRWMAETDEQAARFESEGRTATVRLKMPVRARVPSVISFEAMSSSPGLWSKITSSSGPTGRSCTTSPARSTTAIFGSPTSSVRSSISPTRHGRSSSGRGWDTTCHTTLTCRTWPSQAVPRS